MADGQRAGCAGSRLFAAALALLSLVVQLGDDHALQLRRRPARGGSGGARRPGGAGRRGPHSEHSRRSCSRAIRATPNAELGRIDYRADGSLAATVLVDSPATLAALRQRAEASGLRVEGGTLTNAGGRASAELVLRPA